jgi:hypothetical protein
MIPLRPFLAFQWSKTAFITSGLRLVAVFGPFASTHSR